METLVGRKFKRNVYGLSSWTSTIASMDITREMVVDKKTRTAYFTPKIWIKSDKGIPYDLDEIVIIVENQRLIDLTIDLAEKGKVKTL